MLFSFLSFFPLLLEGGGVLCGDIRITNPDELIEVSNNLSGEMSYEKVTVFLDSDLDFSGKP